MKDLELIEQKQFREWFTKNFPTTEWKLKKLFEEFQYDGKDYKLK